MTLSRDASVAPDTERQHPRRWVIGAFFGYLVGLALVAFWPTPVDRGASDYLLTAIDWLQGHGAGWLRYAAVEFTANVALFVPVGLLVVVLAGAKRWRFGLVAGFAGSCTIELGQLIFLPNRFATVTDIVANTGGAAIGTVLALILLIRYHHAPTVGATRTGATRPCPDV